MSTAEKIYELVQHLPDFRQVEILDFAHYIAQKERPESSHAASSFQQFAGLLKDSETFAGDPSELQRKLRDEWH